jgi:hypothetical protein
VLSGVCKVVYEVDGQQAVLDFVKRYFVNDVDWALCEPCDYISPMQFDSCLVCGSHPHTGHA